MTNKKSKWEKMKTANVVAGVIIGLFGLITMFLFFVEIPEGNKDILNTTISFFMGTGVAGVVYYLFGYKRKTESVEDDSCGLCGKTIGGELPEGDPDE